MSSPTPRLTPKDHARKRAELIKERANDEPIFTAHEIAYLAGAWDARGGIVIDGANKNYSGIRVWVDTLGRNPILDRIFGKPDQMAGYAKRTVWRYRQGSRKDVLQLLHGLLTHVANDRLPELTAALDFLASTTLEERRGAALRLLAARH